MKRPNFNLADSMQNSLAILDAIEEFNPRLFQLAYPRRYKEPQRGSYHSPKFVAAHIVQVAMKIDQGIAGDNEKFEYNAFSQLVKYRVPTYYIGVGLMEALGKTKLPGPIAWRDMHMPYEAAVFLPPKGSLQHPTEGDLLFIGYARFKELGETKYKGQLVPRIDWGCTGGGMTLFGVTTKGFLYHWNISPVGHGETILLTDIEGLLEGTPTHTSAWPMVTHEMTPDDHRLMIHVAHYIFATIMVMTARPALLANFEMRKRVSRKGSVPKEFWTCPVIGENYGVRYIRPGIVPAGPEGTHASPAIHWVRGFTREQRIGPGRTGSKAVWIEPYLRGGNEDEKEVA